MRRVFTSMLLFLATAMAIVVWALPAPVKPAVLECHLRDGSILLLEPTDSLFVMKTKYGTFSVPLSDVLKLEPALLRSAEMERYIQQWMTDLGSPQFVLREKAQAMLIENAAVAYPQLKAGLKSDTPEVAKRCETILRTVASVVNDETDEDRTVDIITTTDDTILRGQLETKSIKVKSKSLGELTIQLATVKSFGKPTVKEELPVRTTPTAYSKGMEKLTIPQQAPQKK